jgi:hypothetical protein
MLQEKRKKDKTKKSKKDKKKRKRDRERAAEASDGDEDAEEQAEEQGTDDEAEDTRLLELLEEQAEKPAVKHGRQEPVGAASARSLLKVGTKVRAAFGGEGGEWYKGVVSKVYADAAEAGAFLYDILYDDGDTDEGLQECFVRKRGKKRKLAVEFGKREQSNGSPQAAAPVEPAAPAAVWKKKRVLVREPDVEPDVEPDIESPELSQCSDPVPSSSSSSSAASSSSSGGSKRPDTAYVRFCRVRREEATEKIFGDEMGRMWREASEAEKLPFVEAYNKEAKEWEALPADAKKQKKAAPKKGASAVGASSAKKAKKTPQSKASSKAGQEQPTKAQKQKLAKLLELELDDEEGEEQEEQEAQEEEEEEELVVSTNLAVHTKRKGNKRPTRGMGDGGDKGDEVEQLEMQRIQAVAAKAAVVKDQYCAGEFVLLSSGATDWQDTHAVDAYLHHFAEAEDKAAVLGWLRRYLGPRGVSIAFVCGVEAASDGNGGSLYLVQQMHYCVQEEERGAGQKAGADSQMELVEHWTRLPSEVALVAGAAAAVGRVAAAAAAVASVAAGNASGVSQPPLLSDDGGGSSSARVHEAAFQAALCAWRDRYSSKFHVKAAQIVASIKVDHGCTGHTSTAGGAARMPCLYYCRSSYCERDGSTFRWRGVEGGEGGGAKRRGGDSRRASQKKTTMSVQPCPGTVRRTKRQPAGAMAFQDRVWRLQQQELGCRVGLNSRVRDAWDAWPDARSKRPRRTEEEERAHFMTHVSATGCCVSCGMGAGHVRAPLVQCDDCGVHVCQECEERGYFGSSSPRPRPKQPKQSRPAKLKLDESVVGRRFTATCPARDGEECTGYVRAYAPGSNMHCVQWEWALREQRLEKVRERGEEEKAKKEAAEQAKKEAAEQAKQEADAKAAAAASGGRGKARGRGGKTRGRGGRGGKPRGRGRGGAVAKVPARQWEHWVDLRELACEGRLSWLADDELFCLCRTAEDGSEYVSAAQAHDM